MVTNKIHNNVDIKTPICNIVVTMFVDDSTYSRDGKKYRRILLRNSYRSEGKVRHDTIANLSCCTDEEVEAIKLALKHKGNLQVLGDIFDCVETEQGLSVGALWTLNQIAKRTGITKVLGQSRNGKLVLWMVLATIIGQGSRLSAVRLAGQHSVCDVLGLDSFNEDDLYKAMVWLCEQQESIEKKLFEKRYGDKKPVLYLYDVTSSYLEGKQNELGEYGYNRDKKKGKKQIVIGLLTDEEGWPISVEVFRGNTHDTKTFRSQIEKVSKRFGVEKVTFVGDRGMIKSAQIKDLGDDGFTFITAITKAQIEKMLKDGKIQMSLFDDSPLEVEDNGIRYILRRNPERASELEKSRENKLDYLRKFTERQNEYLTEHKKASVGTAKSKVSGKAKKLKIDNWTQIRIEGRQICVDRDIEKEAEASRLDGCYVIKTDVSKKNATTDIIHARYKGLSEVEWAFRTMKTTFLEMRGIYVRREDRTRAHVFIVMLSYMIAYQLHRYWYDVETTVEEGVLELTHLCGINIHVSENVSCQTIPEPRKQTKILLDKADIQLPDALPSRNVVVVTRKKLVSERKRQSIQSVKG